MSKSPSQKSISNPRTLEFHTYLENCLQNNQYAEALEFLKNYIIANPTVASYSPENLNAYTNINIYMAKCLICTQEPTAALEILKEVIKHNPSNAHAHALIGEAYFGKEDYFNSTSCYEESEKICRKNKDVKGQFLSAFKQISAWTRMGNYGAAISKWSATAQDLPEQSAHLIEQILIKYSNSGKAEFYADFIAQGIAGLDLAIAKSPNVKALYLVKAKLLCLQDNLKLPPQMFPENEAKTDEIILESGIDLIKEIAHTNNSKLTKQLIEIFTKAYPNDNKLNLLSVKVLHKLGDYADAVKYNSVSLENKAIAIETLEYLGMSYYNLGNLFSAYECFNKASELNDNKFIASYYYAKLLNNFGLPYEAKLILMECKKSSEQKLCGVQHHFDPLLEKQDQLITLQKEYREISIEKEKLLANPISFQSNNIETRGAANELLKSINAQISRIIKHITATYAEINEIIDTITKTKDTSNFSMNISLEILGLNALTDLHKLAELNKTKINTHSTLTNMSEDFAEVIPSGEGGNFDLCMSK